MDPNRQIDEIVAMLDSFMERQWRAYEHPVEHDGSIRTDEAYSKTVTVAHSLDCAEGDLACRGAYPV